MAILFQFHPAYARADILATSRVKLNSFHIKKKKYFHTVYVKTKPWSEDLYRDIYSTCLCSVQSLSCVHFFLTPWTALRQASLSISNSWSLLKLMSIESVMPSNHFILCHSLLLLPSIFSNIRVFSNKSVLCIRWPEYWSFIFSIQSIFRTDFY